MSDDTKHVTPNAPRTLSEKVIPADWLRPGEKLSIKTNPGEGVRITRGTPIERLPEGTMGSETIVIDKINELIDRVNRINQL